MKKHSAGIILYRKKNEQLEVLVAHMGAPWWARKDVGAWSIPKGLIEDGEEPLNTAKREFKEELGLPLPSGEFIGLGSIEQSNNKSVTAWAIEGDANPRKMISNTFKAEWPPRSGKIQEFPEMDRAAWMSIEEASAKTVRGQAELFERLAEKLEVKLNPEAKEPEQNSLF